MTSLHDPAIEFDEDEIEILAELTNIGFGRAAVPLAQLLDRFVHLGFPRVDLVRADEINDTLREKIDLARDVTMVKQSFWPTLRGDAVLVLEHEQGAIHSLLGLDEDELLESDALLEISNLIISGCIGKLSELLECHSVYSPPVMIAQLKGGRKDTPNLIPSEHSALLVTTQMTVDQTQCRGHLLILLSPQSLGWLKEALIECAERL